ncbi:MAG: hypothetical protein C5B58_00675 [Acidobacteria bacterium]|nr:MAG: hypothetical protein C5B58_00675 [Acidobacteriota bacterium]
MTEPGRNVGFGGDYNIVGEDGPVFPQMDLRPVERCLACKADLAAWRQNGIRVHCLPEHMISETPLRPSALQARQRSTIRGQLARRSLPEFQTTGRKREYEDDE